MAAWPAGWSTRAHPLTARVAVNRLWEELFGLGLVETSEDFGTEADPPSHPELIDWLATEYVRTGWDTKRMVKLLVTSAAYRQGAQVSDELARRDPRNRLLARGPRVRLPVEMIRDQAAGHRRDCCRARWAARRCSRRGRTWGCPRRSARPPTGPPAAATTVTAAGCTPAGGAAPYPSFTTFDAPERTSCTVRRIRTNTPCRRLLTLNDPVFVQAAQGWRDRSSPKAVPMFADG
ncbi:MAG: DUF1553 domain-containing protein [Gemmataceae bacterium]